MTNQNNPKSFILFQEYKDNISILSQSQKGDLLDAIFAYNQGEKITLEPIVEMAFSFIKSDLERNKEKYKNIVERNKINGLKGGRPKTQKNPVGYLETQKNPKNLKDDNDNDNKDGNRNKKESNNKKRFVPPILQDVQDYCKERNNGVNAEKWINYYKSNGWKVGKNPMKDWKAAVRTWEGNNFNKKESKHNNFEEQDYYAGTEGFEVC